ncbi:protein bric-a-brac 2-like isoform X2 [Penaeus chinensis]|uniref:protein bric-a-brac 2-like isoform X2 n=2 Tax=Penaeus chinensis TaxID=139456 RepID=UPI001FB57287|nr:protein bric-a-brac 2-like isoform X2 [Penaeus chinensis]
MEGVYWCRESTLLLLEKVKIREPIWNINHTDFMKKNLKRRLLDEICEELKKVYPVMNNLTTDMVVSRYQYLRGHFQKQLRKFYNIPTSSRRTASHKWEFFKACSFMQSGFMINNESCFTSTLRKQLPSDSPNTATSQALVVGEPSKHEEGSLPKKRKLGPPEAPTDGSEDCSQRSKQLAPMLIPLHPPHCNQTAFRATASGTQSIKERGSVKNSHPAKPKKHQALILNDLLEDATFADVTLTAEGQSVKAHKAVLSAMSPYFRSVLQNNPSPHPIIIMPLDMKFEDLKGIINYIYVGEIIVPSENLSSLFKAARVLQISDLSTIDATGLNTPGASSSSSNTQFTHNVDTATPTRTLDIGDTATPTRTNQSDGVRVCTRRKDDINKMQSSNRIQKRTVSSATDHLDKSQKHIHIWANHTAADTDDPLDISNHKRPEGGSSSEQTKDKSSFLEDLPVFLPDGETLSSDIDCDYLEQHEKEFIDSQLHYQGSEWVFHQAPSIISGELNNDATSPVHIKEEFN